jgi:hypothetical protein
MKERFRFAAAMGSQGLLHEAHRNSTLPAVRRIL